MIRKGMRTAILLMMLFILSTSMVYADEDDKGFGYHESFEFEALDGYTNNGVVKGRITYINEESYGTFAGSVKFGSNRIDYDDYSYTVPFEDSKDVTLELVYQLEKDGEPYLYYHTETLTGQELLEKEGVKMKDDFYRFKPNVTELQLDQNQLLYQTNSYNNIKDLPHDTPMGVRTSNYFMFEDAWEQPSTLLATGPLHVKMNGYNKKTGEGYTLLKEMNEQSDSTFDQQVASSNEHHLTIPKNTTITSYTTNYRQSTMSQTELYDPLRLLKQDYDLSVNGDLNHVYVTPGDYRIQLVEEQDGVEWTWVTDTNNDEDNLELGNTFTDIEFTPWNDEIKKNYQSVYYKQASEDRNSEDKFAYTYGVTIAQQMLNHDFFLHDYEPESGKGPLNVTHELILKSTGEVVKKEEGPYVNGKRFRDVPAGHYTYRSSVSIGDEKEPIRAERDLNLNQDMNVWEDVHTITDQTKTWNIELNTEINAEDIHDYSVVVRHAEGERVDTVTTVKNEHTLQISPKHPYEKGTYHLYVDKQVPTNGEQDMENYVKMLFIVE